MEGNTDACVKGYLLLSSSLLFPLVKYIFSSNVLCARFMLEAFSSELENIRVLLSLEGRLPDPGQLCALLHPPPALPAHILLLYRTADSKIQRGISQQIISIWNQRKCHAAWQQKIAPLAQAPVLPSISLIWQDHRLQPHLKPLSAFPSCRVDIHLLSPQLCCMVHQLHAKTSLGNIQERRSHQQQSTNFMSGSVSVIWDKTALPPA